MPSFRKGKFMDRKKASLAVNLVIVLLEIIGFVRAFKALGIGVMRFYTQDSNLLLLGASLGYIAWNLMHPDREAPRWLRILKLTGTIGVMITFVIVITVLSWTTNMGLWTLLTSGSMLYHHTLCPLLGLITFLFLEPYRFRESDAVWGMSFTFLYAAVTVPLNILRIMDGPYPFLRVYQQPVWASFLWAFIILGGNILLAKLLINLNRRILNITDEGGTL